MINFLKLMYFRGEILTQQKPFNSSELAEYLLFHEQSIFALDAAKRFLSYIGATEKKETIKGNIAEFIITEILINPLMENPSTDNE